MTRAEDELQRMQPVYEAARQVAAREFGRAEVLAELAARQARNRQDTGWPAGENLPVPRRGVLDRAYRE